MRQAIKLLDGILPTEVLDRIARQPASATEFSEPGLSFNLLIRLGDRLSTARRRLAFAEDATVKKNLLEIIELLEIVDSGESCPVWQGYFKEGAKRIEFLLVPSLHRRVVVNFDA